MRILIVTPLLPPEPGGPSYYAVNLKEALEGLGEEVDVIAFREVRQYPSGVRHLMFLYKVLFKARKADALIILDTVSVAIPAVIAGWTLNKKMVVRVGGDFVWEHYVERTKEKVLLSEFYKEKRALSFKEKLLVFLQKNLVFKLVTPVVFSTQWQRTIWTEPYQIPEQKSMVIENAYAVPEQKPKNDRSNATEFLWVGRDIALKNVDVLEEAFKDVKRRFPKMELVKLSNVSQNDVVKHLKTARALVLPSLSEVSPNILFEALASGLPVVSTKDIGTKPECADCVVYVDSCTKIELTKAIVQLCEAQTYQRVTKLIGCFKCNRGYVNLAKEFINTLVR